MVDNVELVPGDWDRETRRCCLVGERDRVKERDLDRSKVRPLEWLRDLEPFSGLGVGDLEKERARSRDRERGVTERDREWERERCLERERDRDC